MGMRSGRTDFSSGSSSIVVRGMDTYVADLCQSALQRCELDGVLVHVVHVWTSVFNQFLGHFESLRR